MATSNIEYGVKVAGTRLTPITPAPRRVDTPPVTGNPNYTCKDRPKRAIYRCDCSVEKIIRCHDVGPEHTVSCGCKGAASFDEYHKKRAANLSRKTLKQIFYDFQRHHLTIHQLAAKHKLTKYVCGYAMKAYRLILEAMEAAGEEAKSVWTKAEASVM